MHINLFRINNSNTVVNEMINNCIEKLKMPRLEDPCVFQNMLLESYTDFSRSCCTRTVLYYTQIAQRVPISGGNSNHDGKISPGW